MTGPHQPPPQDGGSFPNGRQPPFRQPLSNSQGAYPTGPWPGPDAATGGPDGRPDGHDGPPQGVRLERPDSPASPRGFATGAGPDGPVIAMPVWTRLDADEAREAMDVLLGWLHETVFTRYDDLAEAIAPCWYRHAEAVEQLTWLCGAWRQAYLSDESTVSLVAEWHMRWAPFVEHRLAKILSKCGNGHSVVTYDYKDDTAQPVDDGFASWLAHDLAARRDQPPPDAGFSGPRGDAGTPAWAR